MTRLAWLFVLGVAAPAAAQAQWSYPPTKTVDAKDTYFGKTYKDPYRWLEDLKDKAVDAWFKAQAQLTDSSIDAIPARDALAAEWMKLDKLQPARYASIEYKKGRVFYKKTLGGENIGKLYFRQGWLGKEKLLFDPKEFTPAVAKPGDVTTIQNISPSPDGRYVAIGFSAAGSEWSEIKILDVDKKKLLPEHMYPSYGPSSWTMDSKAFLYDAGKVSDLKSLDIQLNRQTRLHRLGTEVASDVDILSNESHPELAISPKEIPDAWIEESYPDYLFGVVHTVQREMRLYYAPMPQLKSGGKAEWKELARRSDNVVRGLEAYKDKVYAITPTGAPHYKLVVTSIEHPDWQHAETVLPEADDSIDALHKSKSYLLITYSNGIVGRLVKYSLATGKATEVKLPVSGGVSVSCPDWRSDRCIVYTMSWTQPTTLWDFDAASDSFKKSIFNTDVTYPGFDELVTEEVEVPGHDGTMIPLSIIHKKGLKLDGNHSAILEGYGAYGMSMTPSFSVRRSVALHDVVLAYAHPRGGSEKGEPWYRAGFKKTKPNTWKDFNSCAEWLIKKGYTSPNRLAGTGTSAGGILISRAITERPELFAAAVCNVGCANVMRMEYSANGPANTPEFGTVNDPTEVLGLYEMDGVQHVKPGVKYPALLGVAGWNDRRVPPWEPGKFVAAVQNASKSDKPVMLKVNYDNGHFTEEKLVTFKNFASQYAFMLWQTGHPDFQPQKGKSEQR
jgi:prolyl oligopeptidase